jgi:hypothetical protein
MSDDVVTAFNTALASRYEIAGTIGEGGMA